MQKLIKSVKGAINVTGIVVEVLLVVTLIPVIKTMISGAANLTATETALLSMVTLFLVIGLVFIVGKQTGLIKGK